MKTLNQEVDNYKERPVEITSIKFNSGNTLLIDREKGELTLLGKSQNIQMVISMSDDSLVVNLNARQLNIHASDELNFSAKKINIDAEEQLSIKTGGDLIQRVGHNSVTEVKGVNKTVAQIQKMAASLGNVEIKANDDVRLDGERVLFNCD
jgi:hypothetical protein